MLKPLEVLRLYPQHDYTINGVFETRRSSTAEQPFVFFKGRYWSRTEFHDAAEAAARLLVSRGIRKGDRVGVIARNDVGHLLLLFACARIGAILVPSNPDYGVQEAGYVLKHAGVSAVACTEDVLPVVRAACLTIEPLPWMMLFDGRALDAPNLFDLLAQAPAVTLPPPAGADDTCLIIYTSGTTGFPKGAMHSQRNFVLAGEANIARLWMQPDDRVMIVLPLFHVNALFYSLAGVIAAGCSMILLPKFSASEFWQVAADTGVTSVNIIEAVGRILVRRPRSEFRPDHRIRVMYGVRPDIEQPVRNEFHISNLIGGFGMTEIPGLCCNPYEGPIKMGTMGPIGRHPDPTQRWAEVRVVDDDGKDVGPDVVGNLWVRHRIVMQGYFRDEEQTRNAFNGEWFMTGDLVTRDTDGYYRFVTRKKDIIRRRGESIAGAEIERIVQRHPAVHEVAALPVPSELGEDEILIVVVCKPGQRATAQELAHWCAERLAPMKVPRFVLFADELPHTPTHKIAKHALKADATLRGRAVDLQDLR